MKRNSHSPFIRLQFQKAPFVKPAKLRIKFLYITKLFTPSLRIASMPVYFGKPKSLLTNLKLLVMLISYKERRMNFFEMIVKWKSVLDGLELAIKVLELLKLLAEFIFNSTPV